MTTIEKRLDKALLELPKGLCEAILKTAYPRSFLPADSVNTICRRLGLSQQELGLQLLPLASAFAEAPISDFHVGAVAFDSSDNAYLGANFEFSDTHIGQTIHAEQSAIAHAWARGAGDLALIVVNYAPCGHCRQFMNEVKLAENFHIVLPEVEPDSLTGFLPHAFGPADLAISERILGKKQRTATQNNVSALAETACINSHSPYSNSNSGVAVLFGDGEITTGSYAENAAFNPSLPPLQMALNTRRLQGKNWRDIKRVAMVEKQAKLSQRQQAENLLYLISQQADFSYESMPCKDNH